MSQSFKRSKSLENANFSKNHHPGGPPYVLFILVQGVGFEPTNAYAIGS